MPDNFSLGNIVVVDRHATVVLKIRNVVSIKIPNDTSTYAEMRIAIILN